MANFKIEAGAGDHFSSVAKRAQAMVDSDAVLKQGFTGVEFNFNGIDCVVNATTNIELLFRDYQNGLSLGWETVGPYCEETYDNSIVDAIIENRAKRDAEELERKRLRDEAEKLKLKEFENTVEGVTMEFSTVHVLPFQSLMDELGFSLNEVAHLQAVKVENLTKFHHICDKYDGKSEDVRNLVTKYTEYISGDGLKGEAAWVKSRELNSDPYGKAALDYAERWALLMQIQISNGKTVYDCAEKTSHEADIEGITGFMYGAAVSILSHSWIHGEDLRKWHNGDYNYTGDGVVNPAVITIP